MDVALTTASAVLRKIVLPPNPLPLVQIVPTKRLRLDFAPSDLFCGGLSSSLIISLPQTPAGAPGITGLTVDANYVATSIIAITPSTATWPADEWNTNFSSVRVLTIRALAASVPYSSFQGTLVSVEWKWNTVPDVTPQLTTALVNVLPKRRKGRVFTDRYHETVITSPRQARHALAYVLNNWRRHREDRAQGARGWLIDPFATGWAFDGWKERADTPFAWKLRETYQPIPVRMPTTWLLRTGWRIYGLIGVREVPGPQAGPREPVLVD